VLTSDRDPAVDHIFSLKVWTEVFSHARQLVCAWGTDRRVRNISPLAASATEPGLNVLPRLPSGSPGVATKCGLHDDWATQ